MALKYYIIQILGILVFLLAGCGRDSNNDKAVRQSNAYNNNNNNWDGGDNRDEIKEILELTIILSEIDSNVNDIIGDFEIIKLSNEEINRKDKNFKLLTDLQTIRNKVLFDKNKIADLNQKLLDYETNNNDVNQIKEHYLKLLDSKNKQIEFLSISIDELNSKLKTKDRQIAGQKETIKQQEKTVIKQKETVIKQKNIISKLSEKHLIVHSKKNTIDRILSKNENEILFNARKSKVEIISTHYRNSYFLYEKRRHETVLKITSPDIFWKEANTLIVRLNTKKKLF